MQVGVDAVFWLRSIQALKAPRLVLSGFCEERTEPLVSGFGIEVLGLGVWSTVRLRGVVVQGVGPV